MEFLGKCIFHNVFNFRDCKSSTPVRMAAPRSTMFSTLEEPMSAHA